VYLVRPIGIAKPDFFFFFDLSVLTRFHWMYLLFHWFNRTSQLSLYDMVLMNSNVTISLFQDYELDGVDWTKVDFEDNQECLDVFEKVFLWFNLLIIHVLPFIQEMIGISCTKFFDLTCSVYFFIFGVWDFLTPFGGCFVLKKMKKKLCFHSYILLRYSMLFLW
jgi:hypothetical protein